MSVPFFSIIMPVYQAELYLKNAVESAINQSFTDLELILVDDASKDNSGKIADQYQQLDPRVRVIRHRENSGVSAARNTGIEAATGQYILFWDADDEVDICALEKVYDSIQKNPAQLIVFGLREEYCDVNQRIIRSYEFKPERVYLKDRSRLRETIINLEKNTLYGYVWNKCYLASYLKTNHILFENWPLNEDIEFNVRFCMDISTMNLLDISPYHYKKRENGSLTNKFVPDYYNCHYRRVKIIYEQHKAWGIAGNEIKRNLANIFVRYIYSAMERNCDKRAHMNKTKRKTWCRELFMDPLFCELIPYAGSKYAVQRVMISILKRKKMTELLLLAGLIHLVKSNFGGLFVRLKSIR